MEQNTTTNNPNVKNETKNKPEKEKKSKFKEAVVDHKAEFKKIIWPTRAEVGKKTVTVLVTSLIVGVVVFCMDTVFTTLQSLAINLLGLM
jgi:preprotein translocase subunit SecE